MEDLQDTFIVHTIEEIQVGAAPLAPGGRLPSRPWPTLCQAHSCRLSLQRED